MTSLALQRRPFFFSVALAAIGLIAVGPVNAQLSGTFSVGSGGDYADLAAAMDSVQTQGVSGPVVLQVSSGTYVLSSPVTYSLGTDGIDGAGTNGTSSANSVTLESASGSAADVVFQYSATGFSQNPMLILDGADYLTIRNVTFDPVLASGASYANGVRIQGEVEGLVFDGNVFAGEPGTNGDGTRSLLFGGDVTAVDPIVITNNSFVSGRGIHLDGATFGSDLLASVEITGNSFDDPRQGIVLSEMQGPVVSANSFSVGPNSSTGSRDAIINVVNSMDVHIEGNQVSGTTSNAFAIRCDNCDENLRLQSNEISITDCGRGIRVINGSATTGFGLIANNRVSVSGASCGGNLTMGIEVHGDQQRLFHNSVLLPGRGSTTSYACRLSGFGATGVTLRNNICATEERAIPVEYVGTLDSDYNALFAAQGSLARTGSGTIETLAELQSAGWEANSVVALPGFASNSDLTPSSPWMDTEGTDLLTDVPTDANGQSRSATPSLGALEYSAPAGKLSPGIYTVGAGGAYETLAAAFDDVALRGIDDQQTGETVLSVMSGELSGQATLPAVPGISPDRPMRLTSQTGKAADATLSFENPDNDDPRHIVRLVNPSHLTVENLSFVVTSANAGFGTGRGLVLGGRAASLVIRGNSFTGVDGTTGNGVRSSLYGLDISAVDTIRIENNAFTGGGGIYLDSQVDFSEGPLAAVAVKGNTFSAVREGAYLQEIGADVSGNSVETAGNSNLGIGLSNSPDASIVGNDIVSLGGLTGRGIRCDRCTGDLRIESNAVDLNEYGTGIQIQNSGPNQGGDPGLVVNNTVDIDAVAQSGSRGIEVSSSTMRLYHNSVSVDGRANDTAALYFNSSAGEVYNNVFAAEDAGAAFVVFRGGFPSSDHNNLYAASGPVGKQFTTDFASLEDWRANGVDANSVSVFPAFDADLRSNSPWMDNEGMDLTAVVPTDREGTSRPTEPSLGAYQYTSTLDKIAPGTVLTVGVGQMFPTITEAIETLVASGIDEAGPGAPVTVSIQGGVYAEQVQIPGISGVAGDRPVIFEPAAGTGEVRLEHEATADADNFVVRLLGSRFVELRNLTVAPLGVSLGRGIVLGGTLSNVTVANCLLSGEGEAGNDRKSLIFSSDYAVTGNLEIRDNRFEKSAYALNLSRFNSPELVQGVIISGNTVTSVSNGLRLVRAVAPSVVANDVSSGSNGPAITLDRAAGAVVAQNTVAALNSGITVQRSDTVAVTDNTVTSQSGGISCQSCGGAFTIQRNRVVSGSTALAVSSSTKGPAGETGLVANNVLSAVESNFSSPTGIQVSNSAGLRVYHNSAYLVTSTRTSNAACNLSGDFSGEAFEFKNNICAAKLSGHALAWGGEIDSDFNDLFASGPILSRQAFSTEYPDLDSLQAAGRESNSVSVFPGFASEEDLTSDSPWIDDAGTDLQAIVPEDFLGAARPAAPSLGAYQFTSSGAPLAAGTTVTVGAGADFETVDLALLALLNYGVAPVPGKSDVAATPVTVSVLPGTYAGGQTVLQIPGATADVPVVIQSSTLNADDVTIEHAATGLEDNAVLYLLGTRHLSLRHLTLSAIGPDYAKVVVLASQTEGIVLDGNTLRGVEPPEDGVVFDTERALVSAIEGSNASWTPVDGVRLSANRFERGAYGVRFVGQSDSPVEGIVVETGTFEGQSVSAVSLSYAADAVIEANVISGSGQTSIELRESTRGAVVQNQVTIPQIAFANLIGIEAWSTDALVQDNTVTFEGNARSVAGINMSGSTGAMRVTRNRIYLKSTANFPQLTGVNLLFDDGGTDAERGLVANNEVILRGGGNFGRVDGIRVDRSSNQNVYHNSLLVADIGGSVSSACTSARANTGIEWKNNVCAALLGGAALTVLESSSLGVSDYNDLYSTPSETARWDGAVLATLADLQAEGTDANSISVWPGYASSEDLSSDSWWVDDEGTDLSSVVNTDIAGVARTATPSLGAYQFSSSVTPLPAGTYVVGAGGAFPDLPAAMHALLNGGVESADAAAKTSASSSSAVDGHEVQIALNPGTYAGSNYTLPDIPGITASTPVVLTSTDADSSLSAIEYSASGADENFVLRLVGTDYFGIRGITLRATADSLGGVLRVVASDSLFIQRSLLSNATLAGGKTTVATDHKTGAALQTNGGLNAVVEGTAIDGSGGKAISSSGSGGIAEAAEYLFKLESSRVEGDVDVTGDSGNQSTSSEVRVNNTRINGQVAFAYLATVRILGSIFSSALGQAGLTLIDVELAWLEQFVLFSDFGWVALLATGGDQLHAKNTVVRRRGPGEIGYIGRYNWVEFDFSSFREEGSTGSNGGFAIETTELHYCANLMDSDRLNAFSFSAGANSMVQGNAWDTPDDQIQYNGTFRPTTDFGFKVSVDWGKYAPLYNPDLFRDADPEVTLDVKGLPRLDLDSSTPGIQTLFGAHGFFGTPQVNTDLAVEKAAFLMDDSEATNIHPGEPFYYTITVTNNGPEVAGAEIYDELPIGLLLQQSILFPPIEHPETVACETDVENVPVSGLVTWTFPVPTVTCTVPSLEVGESVEVSIYVQWMNIPFLDGPAGVDVLDENYVEITPLASDSNPDNNAATAALTSGSAPRSIQFANLTGFTLQAKYNDTPLPSGSMEPGSASPHLGTGLMPKLEVRFSDDLVYDEEVELNTTSDVRRIIPVERSGDMVHFNPWIFPESEMRDIGFYNGSGLSLTVEAWNGDTQVGEKDIEPGIGLNITYDLADRISISGPANLLVDIPAEDPESPNNDLIFYITPTLVSNRKTQETEEQADYEVRAFDGLGRTVPTTVVVSNESEGDLPTVFALHGNYPNPFNPTTTIGFDVPSASDVTVTVFDVMGRVVATIADEGYSAGRYTVSFDAQDLSSGVYFYRMQAGSFNAVHSMILVK